MSLVLLITLNVYPQDSAWFNGQISCVARHGLIEWPVGVKSVYFDYENVDLAELGKGQFDLSDVVERFRYLDKYADKSFEETLAEFEINAADFTDLMVEYQVYRIRKIFPRATAFDTLRINNITGEVSSRPFDRNQAFTLHYPESFNLDSVYNDLINNEQIKSVTKLAPVHNLNELQY